MSIDWSALFRTVVHQFKSILETIGVAVGTLATISAWHRARRRAREMDQFPYVAGPSEESSALARHFLRLTLTRTGTGSR